MLLGMPRRPRPKENACKSAFTTANALEVCLVLALFVTPLVVCLGFRDWMSSAKALWLELVATAGAAVWLSAGILGGKLEVPLGRELRLTAAFAVWVGLSLLWSDAPRLTQAEFAFQLSMTAVFVLGCLVARDGERLNRLLHWVMAAGALTAVIGLAQYYQLDERFFPSWLVLPGRIGEPDKIISTLGNRNHFAGYLATLIPIVLAFLLRSGRPGYVALLALLVWPMVFVKCRGAWLGLASSLTFMTLTLGPRRRYLGVGLAVIFAVGLLGAMRSEEGVMDRFVELLDVRSPGSASQRLLGYRSTVYLIFDSWRNTLFGAGAGTFSYHYPEVQNRAISGQASGIPREFDRLVDAIFFRGVDNPSRHEPDVVRLLHAHCEPLHYWVETGLVGLALMLLIPLVVLRDAVRQGPSGDRDVRLGLAAAVTGMLVQNLFSFELHLAHSAALFWFLLAAAPAARQVRAVAIRDRRALVLVMLATLVSVHWIGSWAMGESAWIRGLGLLKAGQTDAGLAALEDATRRMPDPSEPLVELGHVLIREHRYDQAISVLERAAACYRYAAARAELALALRAKGDLAGAERELRLGLQLDRSDVRARSDLAKLIIDRAMNAAGRHLAAEAERGFLEADALLTPTVSRLGPFASTVNADLALVRLLQKRPLESVRLFRTATSLGPMDCQAWLNYAAACLEARQWGEAAEACRQRHNVCSDEPVERIGRIQRHKALLELSRELLVTRAADPAQLPALARELTEVGLAAEAAGITQLERDLRAASRRN